MKKNWTRILVGIVVLLAAGVIRRGLEHSGNSAENREDTASETGTGLETIVETGEVEIFVEQEIRDEEFEKLLEEYKNTEINEGDLTEEDRAMIEEIVQTLEENLVE